MEKNGTTRRASSSKDALSTRDKRNRKRYLCDYCQKHRELTPAEKAVGRLLVNWYNEKAGNCYASIEALANELELSRRTIIRAVGKLHRLGIVRRDAGGGWDHGKLRWNTSKYYPAFELVTHKDTGRPRKNLPPSLSTLPPEPTASKGRGCHSDTVSNCHPMSPPESQAERGEGVSNCHPNSDSDSSGGANAAPASPDGSTASARALDLNGEEPFAFEGKISAIARDMELTPEDLLAFLDGEDPGEIVREVWALALARNYARIFSNQGDESNYLPSLADYLELQGDDLEAGAELSVTASGTITERFGGKLSPSSYVRVTFPVPG